jgi:Tfp pilus tip-associated adhesin PilY1
MRSHRFGSRLARGLALALCAPLLGAPASPPPPPPIDASGDDLFLLTASTSPNVILLMDNSLSMNQIEWHRAFDSDAGSYGCSDFNNATQYLYSGDTSETHCGNTRTIFGPVNNTRWDGRYLNWYFSDAADAFVSEIETAEAEVEGCTQASGADAFAEKFRRTRFEATKQVLLDLLCVAEPKNVRFGLAYYRSAEDVNSIDPNGACIVEDLGRSNPNHAAELEAAIKNSDLNSTTVEATPLSESLFQLYTFWMSRDLTDIPTGADGTTTFPEYYYGKQCGYETNSNKWLEDAFEHECEKAFVVVVTDGLSNRDDFDQDPTSTAQGFANYGALIGDYHADSETEVNGADTTEASYYLDDIAKYAQDHDVRPDLGGDQTVDTYTIGLATDATTDAFLGRTAELGNGLFFHVDDGDELAFALIAALNDIIEKAASFTAAAVPSARTIDGGDFYQSFFIPRDNGANWEGHVRAWKLNAAGDILDRNGDCALADPDAGECNSGAFLSTAEYYWDAQDVMPSASNRELFTSKLASGVPTKVEFDDALTADDLYLEPFTDDVIVPPNIAPNSPLYPLFGSQAQTAEGLADEIVFYTRGCFFGTGVTDSLLTQTPQACLQRPSRLGDVFHSNPIVVRQPRMPWREPSYFAFSEAYGGRSRYLYAGTNAGFLEAFEAGNWNTSLIPPRYDEGTGVEHFGFMPWQARSQIKNFPIDDPSHRTNYVDGSPQVADVWIYPNGSATTKNANGSEWRTMLVTGMRLGGRQYLGLDVTNPDGIAGPGGATLDFPGFDDATTSNGAYGWEFPVEGDPDGWLPYLGFSWSQPVITRVRVGVNGDGVAHERWVAIVTAGYDETGDPNPDSVSGRTGFYDAARTEGRGVFMIDMKTGKVLGRKIYSTSASDAQTSLRFATVMNPAVFDLNADGFADLVVFGDMGGRVYKWVVHDLGGDPINGSAPSDDVDQPQWPFKLFFQAPVLTASGETYYQNFFTSPAAALENGVLWMAFGAGERDDLPYVGNSSIDENNRFYVVKDVDPFERAPTPLPTIHEGDGPDTGLTADLVNATGSPAGITVPAGQYGFYIKGGEGEKFVTNPLIFAGKVIAASFTPTPSLDPCAARGISTGYVFDLLTGEGFFSDAGSPSRTIDLGVGLPTDPRISVGVGGENNRVYIEKSGADLESYEEEDIPAGARLLYWREVP